MLSIIIQWCYLYFIAYIMGFGVSELAKKATGYEMRSAGSFVMAGLCLLTVYAQYFSLFYKVGLLANLLLVVMAFLLALIHRKKLLADIKGQFEKCGPVYFGVCIVLLVLWSYFASRGEMVYDTYLYHGQSIRWIEEYGVVKGLGNLHGRFAYNCSLFALHALLSMTYITGGISLHTANGFFAFLLSMAICRPVDFKARKGLLLSDFAKLGAFYYLSIIYDEVVGTSPDYAVMITVFYLVIKWLEALEEGEKDAAPYGLLCVLGVYAVTLKVTAGLILLLTLKPFVTLVKKREFKKIVFFLLLGFLTMLPWVARTVIISGYLLYPFPQLDLFQVDWKMPAGYAFYDGVEIKLWGRALYGVDYEEMADCIKQPVTEWFGNWFSVSLRRMEKLFILADLASILYLFALSVWSVVKRKREMADLLLVFYTLVASYLYWQCSAPLLRYGYAYVLLVCFLVLGGYTVVSFNRKALTRTAVVLFLGFAGYKLALAGRYMIDMSYFPAYVWQQDYEKFEYEEYELDGQTVYVPANGGLSGYYTFPVTEDIHAKLRGEDFKKGFMDNR